MPYDSTLPANNAPIVSAELRNQLNSLKALIDDLQAQLDAVPTSAAMTARLDAYTAGNCEFVSLPALTVSNPPTQAEVQNHANVLNNLYIALTRT
jgi:hypothetical protein